ncbi:hypothetical protein [Streptomyces sp. NPDC059616]
MELADAATPSALASAPLCATVTVTTGSPLAPTAPERYEAEKAIVGVP